jgi:hypothetical protein
MPDLAKETPGGDSLPAPSAPSAPSAPAKNAAKAAPPVAPYAPPLSAEQVDELLSLIEPKALAAAGVYERPHAEVRAWQQLGGTLREVRKFY